jgi:uncharacterized membrane protein YgcG
VTNGAAMARDIKVDIPLPSFVSLVSVSSYGPCTGTTTLECTFVAIPGNDTRTIDVSLTATDTGTYTSNVTVVAANDSTANNNSASVVVTVNAPASASSSSGGGASSSSGGGSSSSSGGASASGGGGGGGGRIEWLMLALLGVLVSRRAVMGTVPVL